MKSIISLYIVATMAAAAFCCLWLIERFRRKKSVSKDAQPERPIQPVPVQVNNVMDHPGTPLTRDLVRKAIEFNGFMPQSDDDCCFLFRIQGQAYGLAYNGGDKVVFYTYFNLDQEGRYNKLKEAAANVGNSAPGIITFVDDPQDRRIQFVVVGIERTFEHLCLSLMDYIDMLNDLIEKHRQEYFRLLNNEEKASAQPSGGETDNMRNTKSFS